MRGLLGWGWIVLLPGEVASGAERVTLQVENDQLCVTFERVDEAWRMSRVARRDGSDPLELSQYDSLGPGSLSLKLDTGIQFEKATGFTPESTDWTFFIRFDATEERTLPWRSFNPGLWAFFVTAPISAIASVVVCLATPAESDEVLGKFYRDVRPWGFWRPVHEKLLAEHPELESNKNFWMDAFIDNFSRRILAWHVAGEFHPGVTAKLLIDASHNMSSQTPLVLVDGGVENFNTAVDDVVNSGLLKRVLAQTKIQFSNSLIESWWKVLKHQWLYLNTLDSVTNVRRLVAFYVEQHNRHLPHSAFRGQTPDEVYFGTGGDIPQQLESAKVAARARRMTVNRALSCQVCEAAEELASVSN